MTEKRYDVENQSGIWVFHENGLLMGYFEVEEKLNKLYNENEQLKQFQTNVFTLINEMIETANLYRTPIKSVDIGDDLGYWNGVYQKLKELRSILENEETRR